MTTANRPDRYRQGEAQTLRGVIAIYEGEGFTGQMMAVEGGRIRCLSCRRDFDPATADVRTVHRLEGASDPADMAAVVPVRCPHCGTAGMLVLNYGPESSIEEADVLRALPDADGPPDAGGSR